MYMNLIHWRLYTSVSHVNIVSNDGLLRGRYQAVIRNSNQFANWIQGTNFCQILIEIYDIFYLKSLLRNVDHFMKWKGIGVDCFAVIVCAKGCQSDKLDHIDKSVSPVSNVGSIMIIFEKICRVLTEDDDISLLSFTQVVRLVCCTRPYYCIARKNMPRPWWARMRCWRAYMVGSKWS